MAHLGAYPPFYIVVALAATVLACAPSEKEASGNSRVDTPAQTAANSFDRMLTDSGFRGSFLVAVGDVRVLAKGYGYADRAQTVPATTTTAYWTASVAKNFTAAAVLRLADQGKLDVDDRVVEYLDALPVSWNAMTIRQLLNHTSGIGQNYAADGVTDRDAALQAVSSVPLRAPPGEGWFYSNDAYSVLAVLIEVVSGGSYEDFLSEELFAPAGLTNSGFRARPPHGLAQLGDPSLDMMEVSWGFRGGHGIATSAEDLHRWWQALQSDRVLSRQSVRAMLAPQSRIGEELSAGFGWFQQQTPGGHASVWARGTDQSGENAILYAVPALELVIIGLSHHDGDTDPVTRRMAERAVGLFEAALAE